MCDGRDDVCEVSKRPSPSTRIVTGREKYTGRRCEKCLIWKRSKSLLLFLEERSGLDVCEAVARNIHYLDGYESYLYKKEIEYLLETLNVEEEPPF